MALVFLALTHLARRVASLCRRNGSMDSGVDSEQQPQQLRQQSCYELVPSLMWDMCSNNGSHPSRSHPSTHSTFHVPQPQTHAHGVQIAATSIYPSGASPVQQVHSIQQALHQAVNANNMDASSAPRARPRGAHTPQPSREQAWSEMGTERAQLTHTARNMGQEASCAKAIVPMSHSIPGFSTGCFVESMEQMEQTPASGRPTDNSGSQLSNQLCKQLNEQNFGGVSGTMDNVLDAEEAELIDWLLQE
jgi:hypothetical protein